MNSMNSSCKRLQKPLKVFDSALCQTVLIGWWFQAGCQTLDLCGSASWFPSVVWGILLVTLTTGLRGWFLQTLVKIYRPNNSAFHASVFPAKSARSWRERGRSSGWWKKNNDLFTTYDDRLPDASNARSNLSSSFWRNNKMAETGCYHVGVF